MDESVAFTKTIHTESDEVKPSFEIQDNSNTSWLLKNIQPLLAIIIVGLTFFLYYWIIMKPSEVDKMASKELVFTIVGALSTISMQVVAFFFGSSQGSKDKQATIDKLGGMK